MAVRFSRALPGTTPRNTGPLDDDFLGKLSIADYPNTRRLGMTPDQYERAAALPVTPILSSTGGQTADQIERAITGAGGGGTSAEDFVVPGIRFDGGLGGGGGSSGPPASYYDALADAAGINAATAAARLALETQKDTLSREQAAALLARQQQGATAQKAYLESQLGQGVPKTILDLISQQETAGQKYITDTADQLLKDLSARLGSAETLTTAGSSDLMNYLARNQPTAFAQAQRAMPTVTQSALGQYMAGQGVSPAAAAEAARLANIQAAGGASNYNQLLNVLAAREQAAQGSRQAEAEMALQTQLANLRGIYGRGTSQLESSRLNALAQLAQQVGAARLQAEREAAARDQAIRNALAQLLGTGLVSGATNEDDTDTDTDLDGDGTPDVLEGGGVEGSMTSPAMAALQEIANARYGADADTAIANLTGAGYSAPIASIIAQQNIGNPLVTGGIPDYLRVMQDQMGAQALAAMLAGIGGGGGGVGGGYNEAVMM